MIPFKAKTKESKPGEPTTLKGNVGAGYAARIQAIFYGGHDADAKLRLADADGDEFVFPIGSQTNPKTIILDQEVTIKLPINYFDEHLFGNNAIIVWGEAYKIKNKDE